MLEKMERFAPGAGKKHREKVDVDYAAAVVAGNSERDVPGTAESVGTGAPDPTTGSSDA
jgi:hypothetical protein